MPISDRPYLINENRMVFIHMMMKVEEWENKPATTITPMYGFRQNYNQILKL